MGEPLLAVEDLRVSFGARGGREVEPVRGVSFEVSSGEIVGVVGESGSGKSLAARACLRLVREPGKLSAARLAFNGRDLLECSERDLRAVRGTQVSLIAQDALSSLHPYFPLGVQMRNVLVDHGVSRRRVLPMMVGMLEEVGLPDAEEQLGRFPHELSGGMRQRAMIALALVNQPSLVLADEPTTALDTSVQAQVLALLHSLSDRRGMSIVLLSHDLGMVASICTRLLVIYAGRIVESGPTLEVLSEPLHPYTRGLLDAVPTLSGEGNSIKGIRGSPATAWERPPGCAFHTRCGYRVERCSVDEPPLSLVSGKSRATACWVAQAGDLPDRYEPRARDDVVRLRTQQLPTEEKDRPVALELNGVDKHYVVKTKAGKRTLHALDNVSLTVARGEAIGVVGESGSGKSTLIRLLAFLERPTRGDVAYCGRDVSKLVGPTFADFRRSVQVVFQDPYSSLDPRLTAGDTVAEAVKMTGRSASKAERTTIVRELLSRVGLSARFQDRYPRDMSGGERQRVCIARALATEPKVLLADEPVSALDVSIQAQILELLQELRTEQNLTLVLVSHDLGVVKEVADRVITMYLGSVMEEAHTASYFEQPRHPYSVTLLAARPDVNNVGMRPTILAVGDPPSPLNVPSGCRFHPRCFRSAERCQSESPVLAPIGGGRSLACFYPVEVDDAPQDTSASVPVHLSSRETL